MIVFQSTAAAKPNLTINAPVRSVPERMADDMRELAFAGQNVSVETLASRGYSAAAVELFGTEASELARRYSTRQIVEA